MRKPPLYKSFSHALKGIFGMMKTERNFQIELLALLINLFLIVYLQLGVYETALILTVCFLVLSAEIFNTAIEKLCDVVHPEFDPRIGFIKDISAGAVTLLAILSVFVGILIYGSKILRFLNTF